MASRLVQSFSNSSRLRSSSQFSPIGPTRSIQASVSPVQQPHYDSAQLIVNQAIDPALLVHENPNNCTDLAPQLPLNKYKLNVDQTPHVVRRKPQEKVHYFQKVAVRYLKPPPPPKAGDVVIRQLPAKQIAPAPALLVRQAPPKPFTPPPLILREAPPAPPNRLPGRTVHVPGKVLPPPARKVVVERLPPIPAKPQQVFIERWLPYSQQTQRVVYQSAKPVCVIPDPKNVVIQWESPDVEVRKEVKNLGIVVTDPRDYVSRYGPTLISSDQLPDMAIKFGNINGLQLAANYKASSIPLLEGDVDALRLIDLDCVGLGSLKSRLSSNKQSTHRLVPTTIRSPEPTPRQSSYSSVHGSVSNEDQYIESSGTEQQQHSTYCDQSVLDDSPITSGSILHTFSS